MVKIVTSTITAIALLSFSGCGDATEPDPSVFSHNSTGGQNEESIKDDRSFALQTKVNGLSYTCMRDGEVRLSSKVKDGKISCQVGEEVIFSVGAVELGTVKLTDKMKKKVYLQDIVGIPHDKVDDDALLKLVVFLYSLDKGKEAKEVQIDAKTAAAFKDKKSLRDIKVEDLKPLLEKSGYEMREPFEFVISDFLGSMGMKSAGKSLTDLPTNVKTVSNDNQKIIMDGFQNTMVMEGPSFFDWDAGTLTAHNAKAGNYDLTFKSFEDNKVNSKVVRMVVEDKVVNSEPVVTPPKAVAPKKPAPKVTTPKVVTPPKTVTPKKSEPTVTPPKTVTPVKVVAPKKPAPKVTTPTVVTPPKTTTPKRVVPTVGSGNSKLETLTPPFGGKIIEVRPGEKIEHAMYKAKPGDQILIHGGVYDQHVDMENINGTPDKWIKISNYPGEKPIIQYKKAGTRSFNLEHSSYVQINGLVIKEAKAEALRVFHSHHIIISNNEIYDLGKKGNPGPGAHCIVADGRKGTESSDILITGNYVHHNLTRFSALNEKRDDEAVSIRGAVSYATMENNRVVDNQFIGMDIIGPERDHWGHSHHNVARNNYVARNSEPYKYGDAMYIDGGEHHILEYNTIEDNRGSGINTSQEIDGQILKHIIVRNNKIGNQKEVQFYIGNSSSSENTIVEDILFENNYVFSTRPSADAHMGIGSGRNVRMINNYFDLAGSHIIRTISDAGRPQMGTNTIKSNQYKSALIKKKIEGMKWGKMGRGSVTSGEAIKKNAGADISRLPPANSGSLVLGDREITTVRLTEAGHRIKF